MSFRPLRCSQCPKSFRSRIGLSRHHSSCHAELTRDAGLTRHAGLTGDAGLARHAGLTGDAGLARHAGLTVDAGQARHAGLTGDAGLTRHAELTGDAGLARHAGLSGGNEEETASTEELNLHKTVHHPHQATNVPLYVYCLILVLFYLSSIS
jgi:hypothetical protein